MQQNNNTTPAITTVVSADSVENPFPGFAINEFTFTQDQAWIFNTNCCTGGCNQHTDCHKHLNQDSNLVLAIGAKILSANDDDTRNVFYLRVLEGKKATCNIGFIELAMIPDEYMDKLHGCIYRIDFDYPFTVKQLYSYRGIYHLVRIGGDELIYG